jgi:DNA polymerase delta subunit 1
MASDKPVTFHILDVYARDEKIVSANETEQLVEYSSGTENSDDEEFVTRRRGNAPQVAPKGKADHSGKSVVVHLFGKTADGHNIRADVKGFKPFFFVRCPEGGSNVQEHARSAVREYLRRHIYPSRLISTIEITRCSRKELFGFTQNRAVPMLRLTMPSLALFREVKSCFCNGSWEPELKKLQSRPDLLGTPFPPGAPTVYEAHLDPMLRFLHLRNLKSCNWATIEGTDMDDLDADGTNIIECDWQDISPCDKPPAATAPFTVASWDIECMSKTGAFPMATKGDPIIQIGSVFKKFGEKDPYLKHIITLVYGAYILMKYGLTLN